MTNEFVEQAYRSLLERDYEKSQVLYTKAIAAEPDRTLHYWYLGLVQLLQGQEEDAQMTWMAAIWERQIEPSETVIAACTEELIEVLSQEAERIVSLSFHPENLESRRQLLEQAWAIRQHIRQIAPSHLENLLKATQLSAQLGLLPDRDDTVAETIATLAEFEEFSDRDIALIYITLECLLDVEQVHPFTFQFAQACLSAAAIAPQLLLDMLLQRLARFHVRLPTVLAIEYGKLCLDIQPDRLEILMNLANWYQNAGRNLESIPFAQAAISTSPDLVDRLAANYLITRGYMRAGGHWDDAQQAYSEYRQLAELLVKEQTPVALDHSLNIAATAAFSLYFDDAPAATHHFLAKLGKFCQTRIQQSVPALPLNSVVTDRASPIRVGYLSKCLRRHSVGWISRWLFAHHNRDRFEIYAYSLVRTDDMVQQFIRERCHKFYDIAPTATIEEVAKQIRSDRIDILIDLDSLTSNICYGICALKPAPIQVTWLGMDASELPAIDYFVADPFVLPDRAQSYYSSKIWRLPQTYIAVEGFEVGLPNLHRDRLGIATDAIVYLSCQAAPKRHPQTARLQLQILKTVPNSYLLIKGGDELEIIQTFFEQLADREGVSRDRLRFLPEVDCEETHRANLRIADIVLDTYPYNGATTTLETLWMEIPIVTLVGEQFAARNSYTMLANVGVTEGIAHTEADYLAWGIRFGTDEALRRQVVCKLQRAKRDAPLWNTAAFTQAMEMAYTQMFEQAIEARSTL
ncbi:SPINDLY family O-linked N-acetylglucosamine transferase [Tumidithrix helvetica PCC 7403]|uniref:O-linked N-acetylglucosamine transferase, SPINDLY family protein n=1 Tax=Tumidithrix helvetica TaxID=3457545 RepID=UPI003C8F06F9